MPELPEAEVARRTLSQRAVGHKILRVEAPKSALLKRVSPAQLKKALLGKTPRDTWRRGKHILLHLSEQSLYLHLGMSGRLMTEAPPSEKHVRLKLSFQSGSLWLKDTRMLGRLSVGAPDQLKKTFFERLGPDPLADKLGPVALGERLHKTRRPIKVALMDQVLIAGLGNIQVCEILWGAKLDPRTVANTLGEAQVQRLHRAMRRSIARTIKSLEDSGGRYMSEGGENPFWIYGSEHCPRCPSSAVKKITQGGRTTFYCPRCQAE